MKNQGEEITLILSNLYSLLLCFIKRKKEPGGCLVEGGMVRWKGPLWAHAEASLPLEGPATGCRLENRVYLGHGEGS